MNPQNASEPEVLFSIEGHVAQITINRPGVLNAMSENTLTMLEEIVDRVGEDDDIRAVVFTGAGDKAFVAGADISELKDLDSESGRKFSERGQKLYRKIELLPKATIAAVNGFALGGGCELAMSCDIRVAAENARFGQPEINLGIIPGYGGTQRFTRLVGYGKAAELIMTGNMIDASKAAKLGLVERLVPEGSALKEATDLARQIAGKSAVAIAAIKRAMDASQGDHSLGYETEACEFGKIMETEDKAEGIEAFLEKRPAEWKGK